MWDIIMGARSSWFWNAAPAVARRENESAMPMTFRFWNRLGRERLASVNFLGIIRSS